MALLKTFTIQDEMKKNPELKESDLEMLREWLKKQPHLPPISDNELVLFLQSNYFRIEPTKTTIDTFFTVRTHVPEFFSGRNPSSNRELREAMEVLCCRELPSTTAEGYKVIYAKLMDSDPSHYSPASQAMLFCMLVEIWLNTEGTSPGHVLVLDMDGLVFGHVARLNPVIAKKFLYYLQEALPIRLKAIHVINTTPFTDLILNITKPFMKKEFVDMLCFHSSTKTLSDKVSIDILPNEAGGKAGSLKSLWAAQMKEIEDHAAWFHKEEARKVNEAARPGKAKNITDLFGVEGSFKKLDID